MARPSIGTLMPKPANKAITTASARLANGKLSKANCHQSRSTYGRHNGRDARMYIMLGVTAMKASQSRLKREASAARIPIQTSQGLRGGATVDISTDALPRRILRIRARI